MSYEEILQKVIKVFSSISEAEEINEESELIDDLEVSSMDVMVLISSMEEEFGIKIAEKEIRKMVTIGDVVEIISKLKK